MRVLIYIRNVAASFFLMSAILIGIMYALMSLPPFYFIFFIESNPASEFLNWFLLPGALAWTAIFINSLAKEGARYFE